MPALPDRPVLPALPAPPARLDRRGALALGSGILASGLAACRSGGSAASPDVPQSRAERHALEAELDELLADLTDRSGEYEPIRPDERAARRVRLASLLESAGLDALLVEPGPTLDYLAGVGWGRSERLFALVVDADARCLWVTPAFERPRAEDRIRAAGAPLDEVVAWDEHEYAWRPLAAALAARGVERVAVEPSSRLFVHERLAEAFGRERVVSGAAVVRELRGTKDPHELKLMRGACELTQLAIAKVAERLEPGTTDRRIGQTITRAQERLGLGGTWILPLLGPDAAYPHGSPSGRRLARGMGILVDTGGSLHGYQSDITRTWVFDAPPTAAFERAWSTVRDAQVKGFEALRPGARCADADAAARAVIVGAGYGEGYAAFGHRLGHGIGMEGHEEPYLDGGNELALAPGMTFSDEPGIYVAGELGIRLEDIVVVTPQGADHFGEWQRHPRFPA